MSKLVIWIGSWDVFRRNTACSERPFVVSIQWTNRAPASTARATVALSGCGYVCATAGAATRPVESDARSHSGRQHAEITVSPLLRSERPNGPRISCGATRERSQMEDYHRK